MLHVRLRTGSAHTQRGASRFVDELIARVRRAGAAGEILVRADSGFWNKKITAGLKAKGCLYSIGVRLTKPVAAAIEQLEESAWQPPVDYPDTGEAQRAETTLADERLIVRRVRTLDDQQQLFASWQHFAFITNRGEPLELVEREHREHAVVELVIRDLVDQALRHFPSGRFNAIAAWTVIACLAHNLHRWTRAARAPPQPAAPGANAAPPAARPARPASPARRAAGHYTCPPAGPGTPTSSPRWRLPRAPRARLTGARLYESTLANTQPASRAHANERSTLNRPPQTAPSHTPIHTTATPAIDQHRRPRSPPLSNAKRWIEAEEVERRPGKHTATVRRWDVVRSQSGAGETTGRSESSRAKSAGMSSRAHRHRASGKCVADRVYLLFGSRSSR